MNNSRSIISSLRFCVLSRLTVYSAILQLATVFCSSAEEPTPADRIPSRYLIIVETSSSSRRAEEVIRKTINQLLLSGMKGELQSGDTIGVWTFNEELQAGQFPLQQWTPETSTNIAAKVDKFLDKQSFKKEARTDNVIASMNPVIRNSYEITVLLVASGDAKMLGTPFDIVINQAYEQNRKELQKKRVPFVTVFRGQRGRYIGCSTSWSPWPLEFPAFLPQSKPVEHPNTNQEPKQALQHQPQPLIVIGKKPEPVPLTTKLETSAEVPPTQMTDAGQEPTVVSAPVNTEAKKTTVAESTAAVAIPPIASVVEPSPATTAAESPPEAKSNRTLFLLVGLTALIIGVGLVFMLVQRLRAGSRPSLITRSFDHEKPEGS